ncbi:MAG: hypothetical protein GXO71_01340 [Caldiserica bacterium]|nr:hypothetical protein [Caldisericota bacterium]
MKITDKDRSVLRALAEKQAKIASLPIHKEKAKEWSRLNGLKKGRPLVWINELPWHEMDVNGELELQTTDPFCRQVEQILRRTIYQWEHMPADMIVEPKFYSPLVIHDTGFGITDDVDIVRKDERNVIASREFHPQIDSEKDLEKIKMPVITHDQEASERNYQTLVGLFGDILTIEKVGIVHYWVAPWDRLVHWWGVEKALMDLVMRPELIHQAMDRLTNAYLARLKQWEELNLLSITEGNYRVGSGGLGYTDELPQPDFNPEKIRAKDQWGFSTAQIFSEVSPEMHEEFALRYEIRWLKHFGLNYYGCCEPLHTKIDILRNVPNLRKISMSPWADVEKMVEKTNNGEYVLSYKPNPALLAAETWNPEQARDLLLEVIEKTKGCAVEIILKDISTVRYEPQRIWEWEKIAMELVLNYSA